MIGGAAWPRRWSDLELVYAVALRTKGPVPDGTDIVLSQASRTMIDLIGERTSTRSVRRP